MSSNPKEWIPIPGLVSMTLQEKDYTCMPVLVNLLHSSIGDHLVWVNSLIIVSAFRIVLHMCHQHFRAGRDHQMPGLTMIAVT